MILLLTILLNFPITIQYQYRVVPDRTVLNPQTGKREILHMPTDLTITIHADTLWMDDIPYAITSTEFEDDGDMIVHCEKDMDFYIWHSEGLLYVLKKKVLWEYYSETRIEEW